MCSDHPFPRRSTGRALFAIVCAFVLLAAPIRADAGDPVVSNGGYMQAAAPDGKTRVLPLKHTDVKAEISGMVASVQVTQVFQNPSDTPIEAVYVFPLPHRAAVYDMVITVGDRRIRGVVRKRDEARAAYQKARDMGKTAALLEEERANIFTQSVANILPGETITVALAYVEDLVPEGNRYEFVFPMVVGPRYVGGGKALSTSSGTGWGRDTDRVRDASRITPPLLRKGMRSGHDIALRVRIDGGTEVRHLQVVTHQATAHSEGSQATVILSAADAIPNKDFVLRYQLAGETPEVALLTQRDPRGSHFLLMVHPKEKMHTSDIAPREYIFVVDNSGSMSGFPLEQAQALMRRCLGSIRPNDTFNIIRFAGAPDLFVPRPLFGTPANVRRGLAYVKNMEGGGGTEFLPALEQALRAPKDPTRARIVLFITDGYIGYEDEVLRYLRQYGAGSNIFSLGIGSSVNRFLIDAMARIGGGAPFYMLNQEKADNIAERLFSVISQPALTHIDLEWQGLTALDLAPGVIPDLFGSRPVVVAGRFKSGSQGTVTVHGRLAGQPFTRRLQVVLPEKDSTSHAAVPYLWARRRIAWEMDLYATSPERRKQAEEVVTRTALAYNLMSRFTSLVAVDERIRTQGGRPERADQPLPLPDGVSEKAAPGRAFVGGKTGASSAGALGLLKQDPNRAASVFGRDSVMGSDVEDALGGLIGNEIGEAYGIGGLAITGAGRGGGGSGDGSVSLGTLGTIGHGSGSGYGRGVGLYGIAGPTTTVADGQAMVTGALNKDLIRRVIRRYLNQVRYCYQKSLQTNSALKGKVVLSLVIAADGTVAQSTISESTLGDKTVETCIASVGGRMRFPKVTGGGIVLVKYPYTFGTTSAAGQTGKPAAPSSSEKSLPDPAGSGATSPPPASGAEGKGEGQAAPETSSPSSPPTSSRLREPLETEGTDGTPRPGASATDEQAAGQGCQMHAAERGASAAFPSLLLWLGLMGRRLGEALVFRGRSRPRPVGLARITPRWS